MLDFYLPEWAFVIINLVVLTLIMRAILWKRVGKILDDRQSKITQSVQEAEAILVERTALDSERTAHIEEMDKRTAKQMQDARVSAGREYDRIVSDAEEKARAIIDAAQTQAERERDGMLRTARSEVVAAALELTGALLGAHITAETNAKLVESFLEQRFGAQAQAQAQAQGSKGSGS